ncbi:hypothetical protein MU582_04350 [Nocardioidaceae bacterium SCSIO 66511]|nr:hypothetical protein MU582_04350 [Nocardioidaceae bacterium SCSIO 66511]
MKKRLARVAWVAVAVVALMAGSATAHSEMKLVADGEQVRNSNTNHRIDGETARRKAIRGTSQHRCEMPQGKPIRFRISLRADVPVKVRRGSTVVLHNWRARIRLSKGSVARLKAYSNAQRIKIYMGAGASEYNAIFIVVGKGKKRVVSQIDDGRTGAKLKRGKPSVLRLRGDRLKVALPNQSGQRVWLRFGRSGSWFYTLIPRDDSVTSLFLNCQRIASPHKIGFVTVRG